MMSQISCLLLLWGLAAAVDPVADIMVFPLWPAYTYKTYSGMIPVGTDGTRELHYVFLESQNDPATDPVVLWLNGGPGCSSLLGLLEEIGPYLTEGEDGELVAHPYPWNKKANLLFLESPAGVGYSTNTVTDYEYTDDKTASDNYDAIKAWFTAFTQFKGRSFWISGESYAGMYIPYTARAILNGNKDPKNLQINLLGVLIGNGLLVSIDDPLREEAMLKFFMRRNFVDKVTQNKLTHICSISMKSVSCQYAIMEFYFDCLYSNLNIYNVYGYCATDSAELSSGSVRYPYTPWVSWNKLEASGAPCSDFGPTANYLNRDDVKAALHVNTATKWEGCNLNINRKYTVNKKGSHLILPELYQAGLKILIYSGDQDAAVSTVETQDSLLRVEGLTETKAWRAVGNSEQVLSGWITEYNMLTFYVIRGAGHMVPTDQKQNAYEMFQSFIDGTLK